MKKTHARVPGPRRAVTWIIVVTGVVAGMVMITVAGGKPAGLVFRQTLLIGVGLLCWALAVLTWDLAVVWLEYVSRSRHLKVLRGKWLVPGRRAKDEKEQHRSRPATPAGFAPSRPTGLWWLDAPVEKAKGEPPWWVTRPSAGPKPD